jgi:hypothetical protein
LPSEEERHRFLTILDHFAELRRVAPQNIMVSPVVWADAAHAFFNFKEFIFIP